MRRNDTERYPSQLHRNSLCCGCQQLDRTMTTLRSMSARDILELMNGSMNAAVDDSHEETTFFDDSSSMNDSSMNDILTNNQGDTTTGSASSGIPFCISGGRTTMLGGTASDGMIMYMDGTYTRVFFLHHDAPTQDALYPHSLTLVARRLSFYTKGRSTLSQSLFSFLDIGYTLQVYDCHAWFGGTGCAHRGHFLLSLLGTTTTTTTVLLLLLQTSNHYYSSP